MSRAVQCSFCKKTLVLLRQYQTGPWLLLLRYFLCPSPARRQRPAPSDSTARIVISALAARTPPPARHQIPADSTPTAVTTEASWSPVRQDQPARSCSIPAPSRCSGAQPPTCTCVVAHLRDSAKILPRALSLLMGDSNHRPISSSPPALLPMYSFPASSFPAPRLCLRLVCLTMESESGRMNMSELAALLLCGRSHAVVRPAPDAQTGSSVRWIERISFVAPSC